MLPFVIAFCLTHGPALTFVVYKITATNLKPIPYATITDWAPIQYKDVILPI